MAKKKGISKYNRKKEISDLPERPPWLETALQGLAFWMGHRQSRFRGYPLTEGALVAEACNLIQSNIPDYLSLCPEVLYRNIVSPRNSNIYPNDIRADLVIGFTAGLDKSKSNMSNFAYYVIEVKRGSARKKDIDADLSRLSKLKANASQMRCLLVVISEKKMPKRFVKDGKSILGKHELEDGGHYRVRRTVKAASSFSVKKKAHYVCMIEIFN